MCALHEHSLCAPQVEERSHEETLHQEGCAPQSSMGFGENIQKLKNSDKATFYTPTEARVMMAPTSKKTRVARIRRRFRSINAHDERKRLKLR